MSYRLRKLIMSHKALVNGDIKIHSLELKYDRVNWGRVQIILNTTFVMTFEEVKIIDYI